MRCAISWNPWAWCGGVVPIKASRNPGVANEGSNYVRGLAASCRVCSEGGDGHTRLGFRGQSIDYCRVLLEQVSMIRGKTEQEIYDATYTLRLGCRIGEQETCCG
jgi:hypothetical protein